MNLLFERSIFTFISSEFHRAPLGRPESPLAVSRESSLFEHSLGPKEPTEAPLADLLAPLGSTGTPLGDLLGPLGCPGGLPDDLLGHQGHLRTHLVTDSKAK